MNHYYTPTKKMSRRHKVMTGCECWILSKIIHLSLLKCWDSYLKNPKYQSKNDHNRRFGKTKISIFEIYKNDVMVHGYNIQKTSTYINMKTICPFTSYHHALTYRKRVLCFCTNNSSIVVPAVPISIFSKKQAQQAL